MKMLSCERVWQCSTKGQYQHFRILRSKPENACSIAGKKKKKQIASGVKQCFRARTVNPGNSVKQCINLY
jgi:hypothetical protein